MKIEFVPDNFEVPNNYFTENFTLEVLSPNVAEIDYDAVMSSKESLRKVFAEKTEWPRDDMTLKENIKDLERHEKEFYTRKAFAYTVLNLSKDKCIGCVYIEPCQSEKYDCEIYFWVRDSENHLDNELHKTIIEWLKSDWPFKDIIFPGRDISWKQWEFKRPEHD